MNSSSSKSTPWQTSLRALLIITSSSCVKATGAGGSGWRGVVIRHVSLQVVVIAFLRRGAETGALVPASGVHDDEDVLRLVVEGFTTAFEFFRVGRVGQDL